MRENYDFSFEEVIGHEGGFTNDRRDRGNWTSGVIGKGRLKGTKYGVSAMSYPHLDIANLTLDDAKDIYFEDYWTRVRASELPSGLDFLAFDAAINHGPKRAVKLLQQAVGASPDGQFGPATSVAVQRADVEDAIIEFCARRGHFYGQISTFNTYGLGWMRRLTDTLHTATLMSMAEPPAPPALDPFKEDLGDVDDKEAETFFGGLFRRAS